MGSGRPTTFKRLLISGSNAELKTLLLSDIQSGVTGSNLVVDVDGNVGIGSGGLGTGNVNGTGSVNFVSKWSNTDTLTDSTIYDNGTGVGIGTTSITEKLTVSGNINSNAFITDGGLSTQFVKGDGTLDSTQYITTASLAGYISGSGTADYITRWVDAETITTSSIFEDVSNSRIGIGTTNPAYTLDITGTARVTGNTDFVTQVNSDNSSKVATTAFVQNLIGTIPAGLVFQGTWDASTNTPTLTSSTGTTGHFYIVSVDGSTDLDGITDWKVGDWAVFVEAGATDSWEKIDNSSALDGEGTGGYLPKWLGLGSSNTLTDSTIYESGSNIGIGTTTPSEKLEIALSGSGTNRERVLISSTFAGQPGTGYPMLELNQAGSSGNSRLIEAYTGGILRFSLDNDGDLYAQNSVAAGAFSLSYTTNEAFITNLANQGIKFRSTHPDPNRGNVTMGFGGWDATARVVNANRDRDDLLIRRNLDGASTYSSNGSLLRLEKNVINVTSEDVNIIEWADDTLGELGVIKGDGKIGIGTNTPSQALTIQGNVSASGDLYLDGALYDSNNSAGTSGQILSSTATGTDWIDLTEISGVDGTGSANYITRWEDGDTVTTSSIYESGGNIGIGTTSPSEKLTVEGNVSASAFITDGGTSTDFVKGDGTLDSNTYLTSTDLSGYVDTSGTPANNQLAIFTDADTVEGDSNLTWDSSVFSVSGSSIFTSTQTDVANSEGVVIDTSLNLTPSNSPRMLTFKSDGTYIGSIKEFSTEGTIQLDGKNGFFLSRDTSLYLGAGSSNLIVYKPIQSGNANGIELLTTAATRTVFVKGAASQTANIFEVQDNAGDELLLIDSTGNVGIGTTSPSGKLDVAGEISLSSGYNNIQSPSLNPVIYRAAGTSGDFDRAGDLILEPRAASNFIVANNGTRQFLINSSGNVGIGTTSPSEKLTIEGNVSASSFITTGGTSSDFVKGDGTLDSSTYLTSADLSGYVDTSGTPANNELAVFTDADTIEGDSNLTWDSSTLGITGNISASNTIFSDNMVIGGNVLDGFGLTVNNRFVVQAGNGSDWFTVGKAGSGVVDFNGAGGITRAGGVDLGARFNIQAISDTLPTLAIRGQNGSSDLVRISSYNQTSGDYFIVKNDGNVGIGTTTPSEKLTVQGNISGSARLTIGEGHTNTGTLSSIAGGSTNTIDSGANYGFIGGGLNNTICSTETYGAILGGRQNCVDADYGVTVGGYQNCTTGLCSFIGGGYSNDVSGDCSVIVGGINNSITGGRSIIVGGGTNTISGPNSVIVGGYDNCIVEQSSFIGGGFDNCILSTSTKNVIVGGQNNTISGSAANSFIGGGVTHTIKGAANVSVISGGGGNCIPSGFGVTIAGGWLNTGSADHVSIGGGELNYANGVHSTIGGGCDNTASGTNSGILGGQSNDTNSQSDSFIIGSNLTATAVCTTFVNNLNVQGNVTGSLFEGDAFNSDLRKVTIELSSAQILNLNTTPITAITAPGAGKVIVVKDAVFAYKYGGSAYATEEAAVIQYSTGEIITSAKILTNTTDTTMQRIGQSSDMQTNTSVVITTSAADPTAGNGSLNVYITYEILTL